jgi:hypothetical protein
MPRVYKRKARKDYPVQGISKGQEYYTWHPKGSSWQKSLTRPTERQLTQSEFRQFVLDIEEEIQGLQDCDSMDSFNEVLSDIIERIEEKSQEEDDKFNNMPESLQGGPIGELLEERRDALSEWADELRIGDDYSEDDELEEAIEAVTNISISI